MPQPREVERPQPDGAKSNASADLAADPACGRGTGKNAEGACVSLRTRDVGYVERVQIPSGSFSVGDFQAMYDAAPSRTKPQLQWPQQPPRTLERESFFIDLHEVTRKAYAACVEAGNCTPAKCPEGETPSELAPAMEELVPQTCVTLQQAAAFCQAHDGRLPEDYEWEYAARGVDRRRFPWGNNLRDEFAGQLVPVHINDDVSYFGIRGMGSNALEWTQPAGRVEILEPFRRPDGPLAKSITEPHAVVRGGQTSARALTPASRSDPRIGFRCASDLTPGEESLRVPAPTQDVPLVSAGRGGAESLLVFLGVAEAVDRREAEAFCRDLAPTLDGRHITGWRLPTLPEIRANADRFRGPGPFWTADGAAVQRPAGTQPLPNDPWTAEQAKPTEALAARCVHDPL